MTHVVVLASLLLAAGCRQPDGALPVETPRVAEQLQDIGGDIENVTQGDADGPSDLSDDLAFFSQVNPATEKPTRELARRVAEALKGGKLTEEQGRQLARHLWTAVAGTELSGRQVSKLQEDVKAMLTTAGVAEDKTAPVTEQIEELQKVVNTRQRRWFEFM